MPHGPSSARAPYALDAAGDGEEKSKHRYIDFYCMMSLSDFTDYISRDDDDAEGGFRISRTSKPAPLQASTL
jgi:hypothetical protein